MQPRKSGADTKIELHTSCYSIGLALVKIDRGAGSPKDMTTDSISTIFSKVLDVINARSLGVAELGPLDLDIRIDRPRLLPDFGADMLAFAIAVGPDKQRFGISCLLFDIVGQTAIVLSRSVPYDSLNKVQTWLWIEGHTSATCSTTGASNN